MPRRTRKERAHEERAHELARRIYRGPDFLQSNLGREALTVEEARGIYAIWAMDTLADLLMVVPSLETTFREAYEKHNAGGR